ncbi:hypothetical protein ACFL0M_08145 [Thermodesulfobacteriota bacterium]
MGAIYSIRNAKLAIRRGLSVEEKFGSLFRFIRGEISVSEL